MNFTFLPNLITLLNLFLGCIAVLLLIENNLEVKYIFIISATCLVLDYLDGFIARKLNIKSDIGLQLDSLADLVSFGLVPGILVYNMINAAPSSFLGSISSSFIPFIGFFITLCSAYRLARFNTRKSSSEYFIGLPTPANTLLIYSLSIISAEKGAFSNIILNTNSLILITVISSMLLITNLKLMNFKFKTLSIRQNKLRFLIILISASLLILLDIYAIPMIILSYVLISVMNFYFFKTR